ncbi:MAG: hypothetical protein ACI8YQ_004064 [Polaribacter sp.]|jgi:hypothetical protein
MDFFKKVLCITISYFIIVLLWILFAGGKLHLFMLGLQALTFGIISGGYLVFAKANSPSLTEKNGIKRD